MWRNVGIKGKESVYMNSGMLKFCNWLVFLFVIVFFFVCRLFV